MSLLGMCFLRNVDVPSAYCDEKKKKFFNLKQRSMSIADYEQKFLRLFRYARGIIKE